MQGRAPALWLLRQMAVKLHTLEPRYSVPRNSEFPRYSDFFIADQFDMY